MFSSPTLEKRTAGTFADKVAKGLDVELPPTLLGPDPDDPDDKARRLRELRERIERKVREKLEGPNVDADDIVTPQGTPVFPFAEPMTYINEWRGKEKFRKRPAIPSVLRAAQEAEAKGLDPKEAVRKLHAPFLEKARRDMEAAKSKAEEAAREEAAAGAPKVAMTPGYVEVDEDGTTKPAGVEVNTKGTRGAQRM